tara:strand:- start:130 stop:621 length:492 start_codon:yes stop_codon:yes gene_type:complete
MKTKINKIIILIFFTIGLQQNTYGDLNIDFSELYDTNTKEYNCNNESKIKDIICTNPIKNIKTINNNIIVYLKDYFIGNHEKSYKENENEMKFIRIKYPLIGEGKEINNIFILSNKDSLTKINSSSQRQIKLKYFGKNLENRHVFKYILKDENLGYFHHTILL